MNVVATGAGRFVEVQGTGRARDVLARRARALTELALRGTAELARLQREAVAAGSAVERGAAARRARSSCVATAQPRQAARDPRDPRATLALALRSLATSRTSRCPRRATTTRPTRSRRRARPRAATGRAALGDDSGLEVDALGGAPGPRSARYGGPGLDDAGPRRAAARASSAARGAATRSARFVCVAALATPDGAVDDRARRVRADGSSRAPRGRGGFGYDPVFQPTGERASMAELPEPQQEPHLAPRGARSRAARRRSSACAARADLVPADPPRRVGLERRRIAGRVRRIHRSRRAASRRPRRSRAISRRARRCAAQQRPAPRARRPRRSWARARPRAALRSAAARARRRRWAGLTAAQIEARDADGARRASRRSDPELRARRRRVAGRRSAAACAVAFRELAQERPGARRRRRDAPGRGARAVPGQRSSSNAASRCACTPASWCRVDGAIGKAPRRRGLPGPPSGRPVFWWAEWLDFVDFRCAVAERRGVRRGIYAGFHRPCGPPARARLDLRSSLWKLPGPGRLPRAVTADACSRAPCRRRFIRRGPCLLARNRARLRRRRCAGSAHCGWMISAAETRPRSPNAAGRAPSTVSVLRCAVARNRKVREMLRGDRLLALCAALLTCNTQKPAEQARCKSLHEMEAPTPPA